MRACAFAPISMAPNISLRRKKPRRSSSLWDPTLPWSSMNVSKHPRPARKPKGRPRYLMGVGRPEQLADYVALGIDMMDCVLPTRAARHACLYTSAGRVLIKNARYAQDQLPIDPHCSCSVCRRYSRAYLRHLFTAGELTGAVLATHHNVHFYLDIMRQIRKAIDFGNLANFSSDMHARYTAGPGLRERVFGCGG